MDFLWSRGIAYFSFEDSLVFFQDRFDESILANSRWTDYDDWLALQWCWIKWTKVFFSKDENIILNKTVTV